MASFQFKIRPTKNKSKEVSICFRLSFGAYEIRNGKKIYKPLDYYISEAIEPRYWNKKKEEATKDYIGYKEFNTRLDNIRANVLDILRRLENDKVELTHETIKPEIDKFFDRKIEVQAKAVELMDFVDEFIKLHDVSEGTKKSYRIVENNLREYEKLYGIKLTFGKIDIDFYNRFIAMLKGKNYSQNTIGTRIKVLKTFMSSAHDKGLHNNLDFTKEAFKKPKEETQTVYLNTNELNALYGLDLSKNKAMERVRDWFLISAYTGLRFSDLRMLTANNIAEDIIKIRMYKTNDFVEIPLHPIVKEIFEKYEYKLPKLISNQKFNDQIKEICKLAGINDVIIVSETKGNLKKQSKKLKHDLVSAHTARRSFATNAYLAGVPTIQLMKLTGHKSESTLLQYIRVSNEENAKKLQLHPFFKMTVK